MEMVWAIANLAESDVYVWIVFAYFSEVQLQQEEKHKEEISSLHFCKRGETGCAFQATQLHANQKILLANRMQISPSTHHQLNTVDFAKKVANGWQK